MQTLKNEFESYVKRVYTDGVPTGQQLIEVRRAFYGGAQAFRGLVENCSPNPNVQAAQVASWVAELRHFMGQVVRGEM